MNIRLYMVTIVHAGIAEINDRLTLPGWGFLGDEINDRLKSPTRVFKLRNFCLAKIIKIM